MNLPTRNRRTRSLGRLTGLVAGVAVLVAACSSSGAPATSKGTVTVKGIKFPKPELKSITIGLASQDVGSMPSYYIQYDHLDKLFGMSVHFTLFKGDAPGVQALVAGQIAVASSVIGMWTTQLTSKPAKSMFVVNDTFAGYTLVTKANIKTASDLKGKSIAVSSPGSFSYACAVVALKHLGLTPKDVTITYIGGISERLAAVKGGSVDAAILDPPSTKAVAAPGAGYHVLVDDSKIATSGIPDLTMTVLNSFAKKYPKTTLDIAALYQMGVQDFLHNDHAKSAAIWAKVSNQSLSKATEDINLDLAPKWHPVDGRCNQAALTFQKTVLVGSTPQIKSVDPSSVCTDEFVNKLKALGFQHALGVPGY